jgi:predicted PurR-regulated permease PerM
MSAGGDQDPLQTAPATAIDLAIRFGFIAVLGYWSFRVIAPFLTIALWSAILAVALYPLFAWLARRMNPRLAAAVVTLLCLLLVVGPLTWLGLGMIAGVRALVAGADTGQLAIALPTESVKGWPVVGERAHRLWSLAATNLQDALADVAPTLKPVGVKLLNIAQGGFFAMFELLVAIAVAGFLFTPGPQLVDSLRAFLGRALGHPGKDHVQLAGATIRNVARGVIGIALLQALLAGAGFLAAGIPAAGVLAFVALLLGIVQIGPSILFLPIIIWSWTALETKHALLFTAYMIPVGLIDNVLKPLLMARGLTTPMPVIMVGVIGGTIAYGIVGLFFGPIVLSVAWAIMLAWVQGDEPTEAGNDARSRSTQLDKVGR